MKKPNNLISPPKDGPEREMYNRGWDDAWLAARDEYEADEPAYHQGVHDGLNKAFWIVTIAGFSGMLIVLLYMGLF